MTAADPTSATASAPAIASTAASASAGATEPAQQPATGAAARLPALSQAVTRFVNHVLGQHAWARSTLRAHAGRRVKLSAAPAELFWTITPEGLVEAILQDHAAKSGSHQCVQADASGYSGAGTGASAPALAFDVSLTIPLASLPQFALDADAAMKNVRIEGDAELAQVLGQLAREVRWDAEDDLARLTGGAAAHSLMQGAKSLRTYALDASQRLQETVSAFLLDEDPTLVRRSAGEKFARDVSALRDDAARLEKRLEQIEVRARGNTGTRA